MRRKLVAGNWKMNGDAALVAAMAELARPETVDVLICPPAPLLASAAAHYPTGAQDCHAAASGAHTGDISAPMIAATGASAVILGHSERRADHGETSAEVCAKAKAARAAGLTPIICLGETLNERDAGETLAVIGAQLAASLPDGAGPLVIAYEPVWAIGTGRVPDAAQIAEVHGFLRARLREQLGTDAETVRLLYGGSVKGGNAAEIFAIPDVDGALVGGASLTPEDFAPIIAAAAAACD